MGDREDLETFTSGTLRGVDVTAIERELTAAWGLAGAEASSGVLRACLFNLIVYAAAGEAAASTTVATLAAEMPCRALVLVPRDAADAAAAPIEAYISAHCQPAMAGRRQVCCEQVTIRTRADALEALPSVLLGLLVPDLPTVLWWPGEPDLHGALLGRLGRHLDRLVVDSAGFADADAGLRELDAATRAGAFEVRDLAWERLGLWRDLLACSFDAPAARAALQQVREVHVEHGPGGRAEALWFCAWLVSSLGWSAPRRRRSGWTCESAAGPVHIACTAAAAPATAGGRASRDGLRALDVRTAPGDRVRVERDPQRPELLAAVREHPGTLPAPRRVPLPSLDADTELARVLLRTGPNAVQRAALAAAAALVRAPADAGA